MALNQTLIGSYSVFLSDTTSTNDALKLLFAKEALPEGAVMHAAHQTSGRGQQNAVWESEPEKNLLMSVLLKPAFLKADEQLWLNVCVSLAINYTVSELCGKTSFIKWPNDIYLDHHKIAGTLIENVLQGNKIKYSIIGIGLNVNQLDFKTEKAISLSLSTGNSLDLAIVRQTLCANLDHYYSLLKQKQWELLWNLYHQNLYGKGEMAHFIWKGEKITAQILGLDRQGRLHLLINEEVKSFANKEVTFLSLIP